MKPVKWAGTHTSLYLLECLAHISCTYMGSRSIRLHLPYDVAVFQQIHW